jgi:hypothetical protein
MGAAAVAGAAGGAMAGERETAVEAITKIAGTVWDMRRLGWSRSQAMTAFENQVGYKGELLRVVGIVCNFAWSVPKDHYTRNEFVSNVRQQALKNLPNESVEQGVAEGSDNKELYGLKLGDVVKARVDDSIVQGNVIDLFPETMEVELLLRGDMAGRTVTVDVRDTEYMDESGVAEERKVTKNEKGDVTGWSDETPWQKANPNKQKSGKAANLAGKALKQTQKMADEEPKISESKATINDKMFTDTLAMLKKYSGI